MASQVLIIRHVPHEGAGTIESFLKSQKISFDYCNAYAGTKIPISLDPYQALIVMGGPMNVDETKEYPFLADEVALICRSLDEKKPTIGICLGAQLMAKALGARVYKGCQKEIGWFPIKWSNEAEKDPVFKSSSKKSRTVFHWHGDTFDLPKGAVLLASSQEYANQLFRYGNSAYAFQFHIEITPEMAIDWMSKNQNDLIGTERYLNPKSITKDVEMKAAELLNFASSIYENLFRHFRLIQ